MNMKRKGIFLYIILICCLLFSSCTKNADEISDSVDISAQSLNKEKSNMNTENITAVLFAYNYNSPEFLKDCLNYLDGEFGLEENGGMIRPIIFPDDFQSNGRIRINLLRDYVRDTKVSALISLGAPEDTSAALTVLRDQGWKTPVYSLFPQDELLPAEYVSAFVLENADLQRHIDSEYLFLLLSNLIRYSQTAEELNTAAIKNILQGIAGFDWKILPYIDTETGIRPANHFVLQSALPVRYGTIR